MNRPLARLLQIGLALLLLVGLPSSTPAVSGTPSHATDNAASLTVGGFARDLAEALGAHGADFATSEALRAWYLKNAAPLPASLDLGSTLTEGSMALVLSAAGMPAESASPNRAVTQVDRSEVLDFAASQFAPADEEATDDALLMSVEDKNGNQAGPGACCVNGSCIQAGQQYCALAGGVFRGANVSCTPDPCAPGTGTCCLGKLGPCTITQPNACSGRFRGTAVCTRKTCSREAESPTQP